MIDKIIMAVLALAVLGLIAKVIVLVCIALLIGGLIFRPKETVVLLLGWGAWALLKAYTVPTLAVIGGLAVIWFAIKAKEKRQQQAVQEQEPPRLNDMTG